MAAYLRSGKFLTIRRFHQRFRKLISSVYWHTFNDMPLEKRLVERLNDLKITKLTEIQRKSLGPILKGENVIINAETGCGKTFCEYDGGKFSVQFAGYLVPVINRVLTKKHSGLSAVVLVPNMDLGYQVTHLINKLIDPGFFACPLHRTSQLRVNDKYQIIVSTPQTLMQYNMKSLTSIQTVVIDEADLIISNGGKRFWKLLQFFQDQSNFAKNGNLETNMQFIFAAATLPRRGEKSVFRKILNQFPEMNYISSTRVHQYVPNLTGVDIFVTEETKLPQLLKCLNILNGNLPFDNKENLDKSEPSPKFGGNIVTATERKAVGGPVNSLIQLNKDEQMVKVLIFANTVSMAENIYKFLNSREGNTFELADKTTDYKDLSNKTRQMVQYHFGEDYIKTTLSGKYCVTKTGPTSSWRSKVGILHKDMSRIDRQEVLAKFHRNDIEVLVSTDLGSRGLDIRGLSHVVQVDYARNAADTLHRAGRTARAGSPGTVINFITENDRDLWKAIKQTEEKSEGFQEIFSRNRQFSRRIKKKISPANKSTVNRA